jgi:hypothetical protein
MKALFVRRNRVEPLRGDWTGRVALRLRDWLNRYLEAKQTQEIARRLETPETQAVRNEMPRQPGAPKRQEAHPFQIGGPPAHWLERVQSGAPQLLLHPDEGGTPWFVAGQSAPVQLENPASTSHGQLSDSGARKTKVPESASRSDRTNAFAGSTEQRREKAHPRGLMKFLFAGRQKAQAGSRAEEPRRHAEDRLSPPGTAAPTGDHASGTAKREDLTASSSVLGQNATRRQKARIEEQQATHLPIPQTARDNSNRELRAHQAAKASPDKRVPSGRNKATSQPTAAKDLWPAIHQDGFRPSPSLPFENAANRNGAAASFPEIPGRVTAAYRSPERQQARAAVEWPQAANHREDSPASGRSPEDLRYLWPELPSAPDLAPFEVERAMRQWARTVRIDREQRGEF